MQEIGVDNLHNLVRYGSELRTLLVDVQRRVSDLENELSELQNALSLGNAPRLYVVFTNVVSVAGKREVRLGPYKSVHIHKHEIICDETCVATARIDLCGDRVIFVWQVDGSEFLHAQITQAT